MDDKVVDAIKQSRLVMIHQGKDKEPFQILMLPFLVEMDAFMTFYGPYRSQDKFEDLPHVILMPGNSPATNWKAYAMYRVDSAMEVHYRYTFPEDLWDRIYPFRKPDIEKMAEKIRHDYDTGCGSKSAATFYDIINMLSFFGNYEICWLGTKSEEVRNLYS